jgi:predicted Zn-dependent protease
VELRRLLTVFRSGDVIARATALFEEGNQEEGLALVLDLRDRIPEKDNVWIALAGMYLRMGRRDESLAALARAVETNPANRHQLPRNEAFQALHDDPGFLRIIDAGR